MNLQFRLSIFLMALVLNLPLLSQNMTSDAQIEDRVERELIFQAEVPSYLIDVDVDDGIVQLAGSVNHILAKERAVHVATAVKGVDGVVNQIEVNPEPRPDAAVAKDIQAAIARDPATESFEVDVSVENGEVTLTGEVESWAERRLSEYVAKQVNGVKMVNNEIEVDYVMDRADAEVAQEIRQVIQNDIRLHQSTINVQVRDGIVDLSGSVGSVNARNLAHNYAWTAGVQQVNSDGLTVKDWAKDPDLKKNMRPERTDAEIKSAVKTAFLYDPRLTAFKPEVRVEDGIITLRGSVDNLMAKYAAEADAQNVVGVIYVYNHLDVRPEEIPSNAELQQAVEEALLRDADVESLKITPTADYGEVTLRGIVDDYFEKYRAENVVSRVEGVISVENNLKVDDPDSYAYDYSYSYYPVFPSPYSRVKPYYKRPMTGGQLLESIRDELWWSPFVDADEVTVTVENRTAILTGTVESWQERDSAVENAFEGGAVKVVDNLEVGNGETR